MKQDGRTRRLRELKCLSAEEFAACTATSAPVPGGGSVAALAGALAAALSEMVANLTIGKAKYAEAEDEMKERRIAFYKRNGFKMIFNRLGEAVMAIDLTK